MLAYSDRSYFPFDYCGRYYVYLHDDMVTVPWDIVDNKHISAESIKVDQRT